MRKLKLQMQVSVDGYVSGPEGEMDWMTWDWDDELKNYVKSITEPCDLLLLGHGLAKGFIPHWQNLATDPATAEDFAVKMSGLPKIVFSHSATELESKLPSLNWQNTSVAGKNTEEEIKSLKMTEGADIMCYGGVDFVGSLIALNLIDEYNLFINPAAIGKGSSIFKKLEKSLPLQMDAALKFDCGIVVLRYRKS